MKYEVIEKYEVAYANPIKLSPGESVQITKRETNPDWLGWVFCIDSRGIGGWVSETYLSVTGDTATVLRAYDATEIAADRGEQVELLNQEFGWAWVKNKNGELGWIPVNHLKPVVQ